MNMHWYVWCFNHGMFKLIFSLNVIVLFNILKALIFNWHMFKLLWVGRIHILHIELHLSINSFKFIIFRFFCHTFYIVEHLVATLIQAWKNMYPHYQTYGGFLRHGYDHVLFNITLLQLELNIFLCD